jgi:hypothetical protein
MRALLNWAIVLAQKALPGALDLPEGTSYRGLVKRGGPDGVVWPKSPHLAF